MSAEIDRARSAIYAIPADLPRDDWHRIGRAGIAAGLDVEALVEWSRPAQNFKSEQDVRSAFKGITADGGTGAGTLFKTAKEYGWQDSDVTIKPVRIATKPVAAKPKPKAKPKPGMSAAEVWARCEPATTDHEYVQAKGMGGAPLDGLRVVPAGDPLRIAGQSMAGALALPAYAAGGELQSLQFVTTGDTAASLKAQGKSAKMNLPGAPMTGASFTVGELVAGATVNVCESVGTAWACWCAGGAAAVSCFGWSNVARIAADIRQRVPSAKIVLVPDVGKDDEAIAIARELGCAVARMPSGKNSNYDANDLARDEGHDVLAELLERAQVYAPEEKEEAPEKIHPLTEFVSLSEAPMAPRWVIPGFIGQGVTIIAGTHGVGKTTAILPLAMTAAGLHKVGDPLAPEHWRHVIYIVEDLEQAQRIISGLIKYGNPGFDWQTMCERLHIVEARRLPPDYVAQAGKLYREQFTRHAGGVDILPLVVVDTMAATLELEAENDNSEASRAMAALKQGFDRLPVWLMGHVAKTTISRADARGMTLRGASAFEADANQVLYLAQEGEARYLVRGKTRFEGRWSELEIRSDYRDVVASNEYGTTESVRLRWATLTPPQQTRAEAALEAREGAEIAADMELRQDVLNAVETACVTGLPLNRTAVRAAVPKKTSDVTACMERLLAERWLIEIEVPKNERQHPKRSSFLVRLSTTEHEAVTRGEPIPAHKLAVPPTWKKTLIPSVPDENAQNAEINQKG